MLKQASSLCLLAGLLTALVAVTWSQGTHAAAPSAGGETMEFAFDDRAVPDGWTVTGNVAVDTSGGREGSGGALRIASGGKAVLKLRDRDGSGRIDLWVHDDGTLPENVKAQRVGPRWALVQNDGKALAVGMLYASYLGGNEGYTATAYAGGGWYNQLFWLGVNRAPAGWHKWSFVFDAEKGLSILHNDRAVDPGHFDNTLAGLRGFSALTIWGDSGEGEGQTVLVDDISVTLGGPVKSVPQPKPVAPVVEGPNPWVPSGQKVAMYAKGDPPATPQIGDLPIKQSVSQYGITWTFDRPAHVGQFVNGDYYVVGPVTVKALDPEPIYGEDIPEIELARRDLDQEVEHRVRNGFMLNPPARTEVAYDSAVRNYFRPELIQKLPVQMVPGDSLVSTISMPAGLVLQAQLRNKIQRGAGDSSPIRTAAVLTCVGEPQPPDAFRPAFCDREARVYLSRNLKRDLLPKAAGKSVPDIHLYERFTQRPWVGTCFFGFEEPVENMPQYGLEYGRVSGLCSLLLCTDLPLEEKETLLVNFVQIGIDLGGMVRAGHPGWEGFGGHGSGRKMPIVFAGLLLGDEQLANVNASFPGASFGQDEQTAYGDCWTGAKVVFTGHRGIDARTGVARRGTGPYEHKPPTDWVGGDNTSEGYRRCCTSVGWVAQALALRLMKAEKTWAHDAFFDYCDRWMYENDAEFVQQIKEATGNDHSADWARQGQTWEDFVNEMWAAHRTGPGMPPTDGWKRQHDDSYLRRAMERARR